MSERQKPRIFEHEPAGHQKHAPMAHGGHSWMVVVCCVPMLVIAVALVATGVVSVSFLVYALACTGMMFVMMRGMGHGGMAHGTMAQNVPRSAAAQDHIRATTRE